MSRQKETVEVLTNGFRLLRSSWYNENASRFMSFQSRLFHFFPPPRFLAPASAGLSISEEGLRLVGLGRKSGSQAHVRKVAHWDALPLSRDVLSGGLVKDKEALVRALRGLKEEHALERVRISVPERKAYIVKMEIPRVPRPEIRNTVALRLHEHLPLELEKATFDYQVLAEVGPARDRLELQVSAIHRDVVNNYLEVCRKAGLEVDGIEIEAQSIASAVVAENHSGTVMIMDFETYRTGIYLVTNGFVEFTTSIETSGEMLENMFSTKFGDKKEEIEKVKADFHCTQGNHEEDDRRAVLMSFISSLRDELSRHIAYWQKHHEDEGGVSEIILTGSEAGIDGLDQYLSSSLGQSVRFADVWTNVFDFDQYVPDIEQNESFKYASAVGLALRARDF